MKAKHVPEQSWTKAPALFAVLMAINVASYALCVPMMVKRIEATTETSALSLVAMLVLTVTGILIAGKLSTKNKILGYISGVLISLSGVVLFILDTADVMAIPGPAITAFATGDTLFFIMTYIVSDVFSEVFGYKASRLSGNTSAIFAVIAAVFGKLMTCIPAPESCVDNESAFDFAYGGGLYITIAGVLIYAAGDWLNDKLFAYIKKKKPGGEFSNYSLRSVGSSILGKTADLALFSVLVMIPLSIPSFCSAFGMECWGMTSKEIIGNFLCGIAFQITIESMLSPVSYKVSTKVRNRISE